MRNERQKRTAAGSPPRRSKEIKEKDFPAAENSLSALERQSRAALLGLVGCMAGHVPDGAAYPVPCRDFTARGVRHAA